MKLGHGICIHSSSVHINNNKNKVYLPYPTWSALYSTHKSTLKNIHAMIQFLET
jgi:hypothetical protein